MSETVQLFDIEVDILFIKLVYTDIVHWGHFYRTSAIDSL